jgi:hypothetical protein
MGRSILSMQLSVDGFIEGPGSANARLRASPARSAFPLIPPRVQLRPVPSR